MLTNKAEARNACMKCSDLCLWRGQCIWRTRYEGVECFRRSSGRKV